MSDADRFEVAKKAKTLRSGAEGYLASIAGHRPMMLLATWPGGLNAGAVQFFDSCEMTLRQKGIQLAATALLIRNLASTHPEIATAYEAHLRALLSDDPNMSIQIELDRKPGRAGEEAA